MNGLMIFFLIAFVIMVIDEIFDEKPSTTESSAEDNEEYDPSDFNSPYYDHGSDPLDMYGSHTDKD